MTTAPQNERPAEEIDFDDLLKDLDAVLDAWFMGLVTPSLEEARRAREAPSAEAA